MMEWARPKNRIRESLGRRIFTLANITMLLLICLMYVIPLWNILITSVAEDSDVIGKVYLLMPKSFTLNSYIQVLQSGYFRAFILTLIVAVIGTAFSMFLTITAGYSLAQKGLAGRKLFMTLITITLIFDVGIVPRFIVVSAYHLINTYLALVLPVAMSTFNLIIIRNYLGSIPESLMESARIDGCSEYVILARIVIPVAIPIMAAVTLFYFVAYWNRYTEVVMFINDSTKTTIQVLLRSLMFEGEVAGTTHSAYDNYKMAIMVLGMLPVLILYPFIQRYFITGLMVGSIKG